MQFAPRWPGQATVGASLWNLLLIAAAAALVTAVYRREGHGRRVRIGLGILRGLLLGVVLLLLNRPIVKLVQSRTEPSVLAVLIDDSLSMRVPDVGTDTRLAAVQQLLTDHDAGLLRDLARAHSVHLFRFDADAQPIASVTVPTDLAGAATAVRQLSPTGQSTEVLPSILSVLQDLQGQRLAGVVLLSDGRDVPSHNLADALDTLRNAGVRVYPIAVGSDQPPRRIEVQSVVAEESAFKGDVVNVKATILGGGLGPGHAVNVSLKDAHTGQVLSDADGKPATKSVALPDGRPTDLELQWKADELGPHDLLVSVDPQPGEIDAAGNTRSLQVTVLDAKISVLYVDGYPRWEYRYLKNALLRDRSFTVSCLLSSADADFAQEGNKPITRFPESIEELTDYDVVLMGDVDPRFFTDAQLQLISDFVSKRGGGFGMVAGPRWSPAAYRGTPIESVLPVNLSHVEENDTGIITEGFRPVPTQVGAASSLFRFFPDRDRNAAFIQNELQPIFWYCRGITAKPGVGEIYAEHPTDVGPDGRKAPLLVLGRFGAGRTLFSAFDDSWRWRFYTGESVFDTYWVQQLRYLARSRKIGQRAMTLTTGQGVYELGSIAHASLRIPDPQLQGRLPDTLRAQLIGPAGELIGEQPLTRQAGDLFVTSFPADRVGKFTLRLPSSATGSDTIDTPFEVSLPRLELADPRVDRAAMTRLAAETQGRTIDWTDAGPQLLRIPSAAVEIPVISAQPLWNAPVVMLLFVGLIVTEWVLRKVNGMV